MKDKMLKVFHGNGIFISSNGSEYNGEYINGVKNGFGIYISQDIGGNGKYIGEFSNNMFNGIGTYTFPNGSIYSGEFKDNLFHGLGIYILEGDTLKGNFQLGKFILSCPVPPSCLPNGN